MLRALSDGVNGIAKVAVATCMVAMVGAIFVQVAFRFLLGDALTWAEEVARFSFVWLVFVGASCALHGHAHLGITTLLRLTRGRARAIAKIVACLCVVALLVILLQYGYRLSVRTMRQTSPALGLTMGYVYAAIPISAAVMLLHSAAQLVDYGRALITGTETDAPEDGGSEA